MVKLIIQQGQGFKIALIETITNCLIISKGGEI